MSYAYKRGKDNPPFVPFAYHVQRGERIERGSIVTIDSKPFEVKRILSVNVIASGAQVIGKGVPR